MYISPETYNTHSKRNFDCILYFNPNYTIALKNRIERKVVNKIDFENSQMFVMMSITGKSQFTTI